MKIAFSLIFILLILTNCDSPDKDDSRNDGLINTELFQNPTKLEFEEKQWDFGDVFEGEKVEHLFTFANTGKNDLVITKAEASCGCTVPEYPENKIKPGKSAFIKVMFDSKDRLGKQFKKVSVYANTEPVLTELTITANVLNNE